MAARLQSPAALFLFIILVICAASPTTLSAHEAEDQTAFPDGAPVLLVPPEGMEFSVWKSELRAGGIVLRHAFPPAGGLAFPDGLPSLKEIESLVPRGTRIYLDPPDGLEAEALTASNEGALLWHAHRALSGIDPIEPAPGLPPGHPLVDDALTPPTEAKEGACDSYATYRTTSEYMLGAVTVNVILPESTGVASVENWTTTLESNVSNEILEGLNNLSSYYTGPVALKPSWTYHYVLGRTDTRAQVTVEPINNPHPTEANPRWVNTIFDLLGYGTDPTMWDKGRHFNGDQRAADGTDWAFTIFVANSLVDSDGLFPDSWSAYGYNGGPHAVMTYDNGTWGISRMNEVLRHETSHVFYTLDEYSASACTCIETSGYVRYANTNCNKTCPMNVSCLMRDNSAAVCNSTRGMLGWRDTDTDTIPDPVDILPETTLPGYWPNPTNNQVLTYTGAATIQALPNQNIYHYQCDMNILDVAAVQWRVDGGTWANATPTDGAFNGKNEGYTFTTPSLSQGPHLVETRTVDSLGQVDPTPAQNIITVTLMGPPCVPSGISGTPMRAFKLDPLAANIALTWDVATCSPVNHTLVYGTGYMLPPVPGGPYQVMGAQCLLGTSGSILWAGSPPPPAPPRSFLWWIIVANDGASTEGPWGADSLGLPRNGPGPGGSSGLCGSTTKLANNPCGP